MSPPKSVLVIDMKTALGHPDSREDPRIINQNAGISNLPSMQLYLFDDRYLFSPDYVESNPCFFKSMFD